MDRWVESVCGWGGENVYAVSTTVDIALILYFCSDDSSNDLREIHLHHPRYYLPTTSHRLHLRLLSESASPRQWYRQADVADRR